MCEHGRDLNERHLSWEKDGMCDKEMSLREERGVRGKNISGGRMGSTMRWRRLGEGGNVGIKENLLGRVRNSWR